MKFLKELMERDFAGSGLSRMLNSTPRAPMSQAVAAQRQVPNREYVGSGQGGYVDRSTSPHEMDNVQRISDDTDGTAIYHRKIAETPAIQDNPYLPRIRARQSQNGVAYSVVERLVPVASKAGNAEVLEAMWDRMFSTPLADTELGKEIARMRPDDKAAEIYSEMMDIIERTTRGRRSPSIQIQDETLLQAIKFLKSIHKEAGSLDLTGDNAMLRITGTMPQLVFTDPFA